MTEPGKHERRTHFRGKPRPGRAIGVGWRRPGTDTVPPRAGVTRNIGVGGAFILTDEPEPVGSALLLSLCLPGGDPAHEIAAEVRWTQSRDRDPTCAGMGVKFRTLDVEALLALDEYFASLTRTGA